MDSERKTSRQKWIHLLRGCSHYRGFIFAILCTLSMSFNKAIIQTIQELNAMELVFYRSVLILVFIGPVVVQSRASLIPMEGTRMTLAIRGVCGCSSVFLNYSATKLIPLVDAALITSTAPVFVVILARFHLKEKIRWYHGVSIFLIVIGICLLVRLPKIIIEGSFDRYESANYWMGCGFGLTASLLGAISTVFVRRLHRSLHFSVIMYIQGVITVVAGAIMNGIMSSLSLPDCGRNGWLVVSLGILTFGGQLMGNLSLKYEEAGTSTIVRLCSRIIFSFLIQTFVLNQEPDGYSISAAVTVGASMTILAYQKRRSAQIRSAAKKRERADYETKFIEDFTLRETTI